MSTRKRGIFKATSMAVAAAFLLPAAVVATSAPVQAASSLDSDGDGIPDDYEIHGYDADHDGKIDIDFPKMGADPLKKDIFVEMDTMDGLMATAPQLDQIVDTFAKYPVRNPNGTTGINIHLDAGSSRGAKYDLGYGGTIIPTRNLDNGVRDVENLRKTNSPSFRNNLFHYMVWGDSYGDNSSSGEAWIDGMEFLVTVGPTYWKDYPESVRVGTFIHELGHNLGLLHGGNENTPNFKPNYLSIMNYRYQTTGLRRADGTVYYGYSQRAFKSIDENALDETKGLGPEAKGWMMYGGPMDKLVPGRADQPFDYNNNGRIDTVPVQYDFNDDDAYSVQTASNDLAQMRFQANPAAGGMSRKAKIKTSHELTAEQARKFKFDAKTMAGCGCPACMAAVQSAKCVVK